MTVAAPPRTAAQRVSRLSPAQLEAHLLARTARTLDVRDPATIAEAGHIPGAVRLPSLDREPELEAFTVVYGTSEDDSRSAAEALASHGDRDIAYLTGGFTAWQDAEMAIAGLSPWHAHSIPTVTITETRTS